MEEATVVIVSKTLPDSETVNQMTAQGVRTMGEICAFIFFQGNPQD